MARDYIIGPNNWSNSDGQPPGSINFKYRLGREMDELIGLCKGIVSDGIIVEQEAKYLGQWLHTNSEIAQFWPAKDLAARLGRIFLNGRLEDEERDELFLFLQHLTGEVEDRLNLLERLGHSGQANASTTLPLDRPAPEIVFAGKYFCFTGKCLSGTRRWCEIQVQQRGGISVSRAESCDFLVVGVLGSRDWAHSSHGRKIEAAMRRKADNAGWPKIIGEEHWVEFLDRIPAS